MNKNEPVEEKNSDFAAPKSGWRNGLIFLVGLCLIIAAAASLLPRAIESEVGTDYLTAKVTRGDLAVTITEQGTLESSDNTEIKCKVRGQNTVIEVVEGGTHVRKGDVLLRLDTLQIEEAIAERTKYAHWSLSAAERSKADVARSTIAIEEYEKGRFKAQLMTLEKQLAVARATLTTAKAQLEHTQRMKERGFRTDLEVDAQDFLVRKASAEVGLKNTEIDVLQKYTMKEELETLQGNLKSTTARHQADHERAFADVHRRGRALEELEHCVIRAPRDGLVIYPSAAAWKNAPDIEEGATVHKEQILLLMPDLNQMQVKVGVHESVVDRVHPGLKTIVTLSGRKVDAEVNSVATVTSPAGWWTGNVVKYDTIVRLPREDGLKPGMSAEVQIVMATHSDVLMVPVSAVVETQDGAFCWVNTQAGPERRIIETGDSNDVYIIIESGVSEGDDVILNPLAFVREAQLDVLKPGDKARMEEIRKRKKEEDAKASQGPPNKGKSTGSTETNKQPSQSDNEKSEPESRPELPSLDELRRTLTTDLHEPPTADKNAGKLESFSNESSFEDQPPSTSPSTDESPDSENADVQNAPVALENEVTEASTNTSTASASDDMPDDIDSSVE